MTKLERAEEVVEYALRNGDSKAREAFGVNEESLARYKRTVKKLDPAYTQRKLLQKIAESYSPEELEAIARGARVLPGLPSVPHINFGGECVTFAHITDLHMGSVWYQPAWWRAAVAECEKEKVQFIALSGDISEGLSKRDGHVYELTHIGYSAQRDFAVSELDLWGGRMVMVDGNHDRWYIKGAGAWIVQDICKDLGDRAQFLGSDEGDYAVNGVTMRLWHGEDASSYATSYRVQKLIESFTGGEKPNVLLCGHTHKQGYFFERHVHALSGGALCRQSAWMRSKRLAVHSGFWIVRAWIDRGSVNKFQPTWYPFYS